MDLRLNRTFWGYDVEHLPRDIRKLLGSEMHSDISHSEADCTLKR